MLNVAVTGASGRMGSKIIKNILKQEDMRLVAAIEAPETPLEGKDVGEHLGVGEIGVKISGAESLKKTLIESKPDVLVDFTIADAATTTIITSAECGVDVVVGTTGFTDKQLDLIKKTVTENNIRAIISPNMAIGVNVFFKILEILAPVLADYDVEIIEAHHKHKQDAPSGTAVRAAEIIAQRLDRDLDEVGVYGRQGLVGERRAEEIGLHAIRGGDIVGDHLVLFAGEGERIEIIHRAHSRQSFVSGVIKALRYISHMEKGKINDMQDVIGLRDS